ncbi:DUF1176 domain-containing protein [Edaphovirga cremea]|uniref:DUF1176 domain-containing protein n=1 Tax=Edaphovirga cremea TaxID=2267246 RepID=UPI003988CAF6
MMSRWIPAPLLLLATLFATASHADPIQKNFSDWMISCDNINRCQIRNVNDHHDLVMQITREAGREGKASISIDYQRLYDDSEKNTALANTLMLDSRRMNINPREWQTEKNRISTENRLVVNEFIAGIREGSRITLTGKFANEQDRLVISLTGLKAALLAMDEQQSRIDTQTAWAKKGVKPADQVPDAPLPPEAPLFSRPQPLTDGEVAALTQFAATNVDTNDCTLESSERDVSLSALSGEKALMMINCDRGAYNLFVLAFTVTRHAPFKIEELDLTLPFSFNQQENQSPELINVDFDEKSGQLGTYAKGRGIGDCGESSQWVFDGTAFQLTNYASEPNCDGYRQGGEWPELWVTR